MANFNRHLVNREGVWYIGWTYKGQRHSLSTKIPVGIGTEQRRENLALARAARDRFQADVRRARGRDPEGLWRELVRSLAELPADAQRDLRRRWADELLAAVGRRLELSAVWDAWVGDPQRGNAGAATLIGYESQWRRFEGWAADRALETLQDVGEAHAREYSAELWGSGVAPGTYNGHVGCLRAIWSVLQVPYGLRGNPWMAVRRMESAPAGRKEFTADQIRLVLETAGDDWRAMVGLGLYTALRMGDVACLPWSAVDLARAELAWTPRKTSRKQQHVRVPLHRDLVALLARRREFVLGEWVFPEQRSVYLGDRAALAKQFQELLTRCGIEAREAGGAHRRRAICRYGFHSLRHSFVSICRRAGVPEMVVAEMVGHSSPAMTRLYTHGSDESRAAAIAALPALAG